MDELITIIEERKKCIHSMIQEPQQKHKSTIVEEQRKRNERENWILRVLKTLKLLSIQQKKIILEITIKIMNYYQPMEAKVDDYEHINYIETFINLFVEFYNKFQDMDLTHIKTIIRPNNSYIMVDLIKSLVQLGRREFKNAVQNQFKDLPTVKTERKSSEQAQKQADYFAKPIFKSKQKVVFKKPQFQKNLIVDRKIQQALVEKYQRFVEHYNPQVTHQKFNEIYFDLLYMNQKNAIKIQKHLDSCFGRKRHINYDVSGLYTQDELNKIVSEHKEKASNKAADLKQLRVDCSPEHLKEYFKMKVEIYEAHNIFPANSRITNIRPWLPLVMSKCQDKLHPFLQMVESNGSYCSWNQFQQKCNKKLRIYLKQSLNDFFKEKRELKLVDLQLIPFNRRDYLDFNNAKLLQLLNKQIIQTYKKEKDKLKDKELLFPLINSSSQTLLANRPAKSKSETKLPNTSLIIPYSKISDSLGQILQKRMNFSSLSKQKIVSTRKMDYVIDNIIKTRECTLS